MNTDITHRLIGRAQSSIAEVLYRYRLVPEANKLRDAQRDLTDAANALSPTTWYTVDDLALDAFQAAMREKLGQARQRGRSGWNDPERCDVHYLAQLLLEQVERPTADPVDIANFAMFLHQRPGGTEALRATIRARRGIRSED